MKRGRKTTNDLRERKHDQGEEAQQGRRPMKSEVFIHCVVVRSHNSQCHHLSIGVKPCLSEPFKQFTPYHSLEIRYICPSRGISACCMQSTDPPALGKSTNLLCMPNRGKIPPKLDRMKLFAASALAAKVGYASTRNVKTPEKTRIVLCATREHVSIVRIQNIPNAGGRPVGTYPAPKRALPMMGAIQCTSG